MHTIELKNISKEFNGVTVLNDINLYIQENEFLTLFRTKWMWKTTTLRIIGGFEEPTKGTVLFEEKDITDIPPIKDKLTPYFKICSFSTFRCL